MLLSGRVVFRFGRIASPTRVLIPERAPAGSEPFKTVNGAPLWNVKNPLICQPPSKCPLNPAGPGTRAIRKRSCRSGDADDRRLNDRDPQRG